MSGELLLLPDFDHHSLTPEFRQISVANRYSVQSTNIPVERPILSVLALGHRRRDSHAPDELLGSATVHDHLFDDFLCLDLVDAGLTTSKPNSAVACAINRVIALANQPLGGAGKIPGAASSAPVTKKRRKATARN